MWIDIAVTLLLALRLGLVRPTAPLLPESSDEDSSMVTEDEEKNGLLVGDGDVDNPVPFTEVLHAQNRDCCNYIYM